MKKIVTWRATWIDREKAREATPTMPGIGGLICGGFRTETDARAWRPYFARYDFVGVEQESHEVDDDEMVKDVKRRLATNPRWEELTLCPDDSPWIDLYREIAVRAGGVFDRDSRNGDAYVVIRRNRRTVK